MSKIRALILAAGRGSRMKEGTCQKPKCLNKIAGKPLLNWQFDSLKKAGINEIGIIKGYKAEMLNEGDYSFFNKDWNNTNMVYSLFCANSVDYPTIISYSDITYNSNHVKKLIDAEGDIVITADLDWKLLWSLRFENPLDDAETFISENGVLKEIGKRTNSFDNIQAQYMGLMKLTKKGWDTLNEIFESLPSARRLKLDMTTALNLLLQKNIRIGVVFVNGKWCEADTLSDIVLYEKSLKDKNWTHDWR